MKTSTLSFRLNYFNGAQTRSFLWIFSRESCSYPNYEHFFCEHLFVSSGRFIHGTQLAIEDERAGEKRRNLKQFHEHKIRLKTRVLFSFTKNRQTKVKERPVSVQKEFTDDACHSNVGSV